MLGHFEQDLRARLARQLDGRLIESAETTRQVYATLLDAMSDRFAGVLKILRSLDPLEVVLVESAADDVCLLFRMMGVEAVTPDSAAFDPSRTRLLVKGCVGRSSSLSSEQLAAFLERGGILVTSDRTIAALPHRPEQIVLDEPAPPRRGRVKPAGQAAVAWAQVVGEGHEFAPAVALDAGYLPIDVVPSADESTVVLAHDALGGHPLVVVAPVGNGWLLHSVAHWYQRAPDRSTAVERRPVASLQGQLSGVGLPAETSVGLFLAARVMLFNLLYGLEATLRHAGYDVDSGVVRARV